VSALTKITDNTIIAKQPVIILIQFSQVLLVIYHNVVRAEGLLPEKPTCVVEEVCWDVKKKQLDLRRVLNIHPKNAKVNGNQSYLVLG
jgi:hypothetical protein